MKNLLIAASLLLSYACNAQKELDSIIVLKVSDTSNLYNRIKWALVNADFIVKDLPIQDTITTYGREFLNNNYMKIKAVINNDEVKFSGIWGSRKLDGVGFAVAPSEYKRIIYYKGCVECKIMRHIAESIGGTITFKK